MRTKIGKFLKALGTALVDETKEVASLVPTDEDCKQGKRLAVLTVTAMTAMGIPSSTLATEIIAKVYAYGIRDLKDGVSTPDKLIIKRVINEIKKEKAEGGNA